MLTIIEFALALVAILIGAAFFTNAVEILGSRLGLQQGAVGSLLAAVGTALPESMIAIVAILVSVASGILTAAWVALLYIGIQIVEGMLEPIVQQRAVYLPPVLLLVSQLALGVLVGFVGIVLATPLAAALMVMVQMLYVEDVLQDPVG